MLIHIKLSHYSQQKRFSRTCLQYMHNTLARVVVGPSAPLFRQSSDILCHLHWLPVEYRVKFKFAKLTYNVLNNSTQLHLSSLLHHYALHSSLRSGQSNTLYRHLLYRTTNSLLAHVNFT